MVPLYLTAVVSALVIGDVRVSGASVWGNRDENSLSKGLTALLELAMRQDLPEMAVHKENPLQNQQSTMRHKQAMAVAVEMLLKQLLREEQMRRQNIEEQQETIPGPTSKPSYGAPKPSYRAPKPSYGAPKPSYGAPKPSYGAPKPSYKAPKPSYAHQLQVPTSLSIQNNPAPYKPAPSYKPAPV